MDVLGAKMEYYGLNDICSLQSHIFECLLPRLYHCFENLGEVGDRLVESFLVSATCGFLTAETV